MSEFVWGAREVEGGGRGRERSACRGPRTPQGLRDGQPTLPTTRASRSPVAFTPAAHPGRLSLPPTLAGLRWTGGSLTHVGQACQHCAETVKQSQQGQDFRLRGEVQYQHAFQGGRCLARLAACTAEATKPVGTIKCPKYGFNRPTARSAAMMGVCGQRAVLGLNLTKLLRGAAGERGIALAA